MVDAGISCSRWLPGAGSQRAPEEPGVFSGTVLPSFKDASALMSGRYSCLVLDTHRRHMALPPKYLSKKRTGIRDQLNVELLRYSEGLNGVPVAYDDIKIIGELGDIHDDEGSIHLNIEAEFVVFRPKIGEKLVGVVNKAAPSHIGCLVHGCFNASIPKPNKMSAEDWQNLGVKIGDRLEFEVLRLDSDAVGVFCIRGKLDLESLKITSSEVLNDGYSGPVGNMDGNVVGSVTETPAMDAFLNGVNVDSGTEDTGDCSSLHLLVDSGATMENEPLQEKAKKKKNKHKQQEPAIQGRDLCGYLEEHKNPKKKKRKRSEDDLSQEPQSKKKRRD